MFDGQFNLHYCAVCFFLNRAETYEETTKPCSAIQHIFTVTCAESFHLGMKIFAMEKWDKEKKFRN